MSPKSTVGFWVLALCLLSPAARAETGAESPGTELKTIENKMETARRAVREKEEAERGLLAEMERLDRQLEEKKSAVSSLRSSESGLAERVAESARRLSEIGRRGAEARRRLGERAAALYKYGQVSYLGLLLGGQGREDLERRLFYLRRIARHDADLATSARALYDSEEKAGVELAAQREKLARTRDSLLGELAALSRKKEEKRHLLAGLRNERDNAEALLQELESASARLLQMMETLRKQAGTESDFPQTKGRLEPPVPGNLIKDFGRRKNPRSNTYTVSRGITLRAAEGTPVRAVWRGRVMYADWFRGYGRIVILDHGGGYYTLYGHLSSLSVAVGDEADAGQTIGQVGETGSLEGPALYFEIRNRGKPEDPKPWFAAKPK